MKAKKTSPLNYVFAVGKIRALERYLIRQGIFEEAIASDINQALRLFVESGLYADELSQIKDSRQLEEVLNKALLDLKRQVSDLILDKTLLLLLDLDGSKCVDYILKNFRNRFLKDYIRHLIDMYNIKTFLRLYILKEPLGLLERNLISEGFIKRETFLKFYAQDLISFVNKLEYVHMDGRIIDYAFFLREAILKAEQTKSFVALEKAINDFLIRILESGKYSSFGPEAVLAYYFAKVNEISLIRMIILAKLNDVPIDLVKMRLNSVYA